MVRVTLSALLVILTYLHNASSNLGTSFLVTCPDSLLASAYIEYMLYVNSPDSSTNIVVATPLLGSNIFTGSVGQGESKEILLSSTYMIRGTGTSSYAVVINSTSDVSVYVVLKPGGDGYMALPVDALGTEYYVMTYCDHPGHKPCEFTITAAEPSTQIEVTLSIINTSATVNLTGTIYRHGDVITETLIQYQTLQIQCDYDLTGTLIVANRRVAVIGGGAGSTVSLGATPGVLLEQYPPVSTYGTEILAIPSQFVKSAPGDYYRILVAHPFTTIQIGVQNRKLIREAGDWFQTNISDISVISSDKPIVVARLTLSSETVPSDERPTLMILVPIEQFLPKSTSVLLPKSNTPDNKVILVSKTPGHTSIQINSNLQDLGWTPVAGANLVIKYYTTNAFNAQQISSPLASFTVYYQTNSDEYSTSYVGGMMFNVSNPLCIVSDTGHGDTVDNDCDGLIDEDICPFNIDQAVSGQDCKEFVSGERDSYGRRFVMAFPGNMQVINMDALYLVFSSLSSLSVTVTVKTPLDDTRLLISRTFQTSDYISFSDELEMHGEGVSDLGILIEASEEISVYSMSVKSASDTSAGATRLIPTESIGKDYYAVTTCLVGSCQITIVADHPATIVKVRLHFSDSSARLQYGGQNYYSGDFITETLSQYQVWQLQSIHDLTGTRILGNKPISVFSGANYTQFKIKQQKDQMVEQLFPVNAWGKEFIVIQTAGRMGTTNCYFSVPSCADTVRVIAAEANTALTIKHGSNEIGSTYNLDLPGDWIRFDLINDTAYITSNKGISVNQLMSDGVKGDAALLVIVPVEQYASMDILRNVPDPEPAINNLMLSTETDFESSIFVNSNPIIPPWETLPGGRSFYRTEVTDTETRVSTANSSIRVGGYLYVNKVSVFSSHILNIASFFLWINTPCEITDAIAGDGIDNDCDGAIDEEPCDETSPEDSDMDGMFNEDCVQPLGNINIHYASYD
ncbi:uncharacterized protein LOC126830950 isoform X1 [Patella vulgata]|uniref:uncharacterized protein LOC126830950 isoform X1 n=1 Tax=Patella vulgata TaxID=6465 RepID=UPI0024A93696|nr:uncharacterized protein LOC126830950 isoform X1 [Patella vulgata]XP_055959047.1 uncharacterized protein LOC126830950 isoform X1 [Patella vulgata]XP_055959048.1 uncharacterized protein LOC126830950 isoform X1 [Patella vulgata]